MTTSRLFSLLAGLFVTAAVSHAQTPAIKLPGVFLNVKNVGSKKDINSTYETTWGSYEREFYRATSLEAEVGTVSSGQHAVELEWFFIGETLKNRAKVLLGHGRKSLNIAPGKHEIVKLSTGDVQSTDHKYVLAGTRYVSGSRIKGWYTRVLIGEKVAAERASSEDLQRYCKSPDFAALLNAYGANQPAPTPYPAEPPAPAPTTPVPSLR